MTTSARDHHSNAKWLTILSTAKKKRKNLFSLPVSQLHSARIVAGSCVGEKFRKQTSRERFHQFIRQLFYKVIATMVTLHSRFFCHVFYRLGTRVVLIFLLPAPWLYGEKLLTAHLWSCRHCHSVDIFSPQTQCLVEKREEEEEETLSIK